MILLIECVVACVFFTLIILPAQYKDPLKMIASYPPEVIKRVEELPQCKATIKQHKKAHISKKIFGLVFFVALLSTIAYFSGCKNFISTFLHVFTLFTVVNLYDLIVLDWGVFCHSQRLRIPGTEDMDEAYKDYAFHLKGAGIGTLLGLVVSLLSGGIIHLISML